MFHRFANRTSILIASLGIILFSLLLTTLLTQSAAADCAGVKTTIINCGSATTAANSADNPVISVLTFVMQILTGAVGVAAIGALIYAGILYSAAGGESGQVQKAKTLIKDTVIGIVCYGGMIIILNFIIPGGVFGQQGVTGSGTAGSTKSENGGNAVNNPSTSLKLSITTWNVLKTNSSSKVVSGLKTILEASDMVGIQEAGPSAKTISTQLACSTCKYAMFPSADVSARKVAILWNKDKFKLLDKGYTSTATQGGIKKYVVWIKLQGNASGKIFYMLNTHAPAFAGEGPGFTDSNEAYRKQAVAAYKQYMPNTVEILKKFQQEKLPIFFTGDFAVNYRKDDCSNKYYPCYALSHNLNVKSGWEYTKLKDISGSMGTIEDSTRIPDNIFSWNLDYITYQSNTIRGGSGNGWSGSDHKPATLGLTIGAKK